MYLWARQPIIVYRCKVAKRSVRLEKNSKTIYWLL